MTDLYRDREQTATKHFILEKYLQALAFKILQSQYQQLAYIDGFSGPWKARSVDFADTSFMIAINRLKEVQKQLLERGKKKVIKCFFSEADPKAYAQLKAAVEPHQDAAEGFFIETYEGRFQDAIPNILSFIGTRAFPLIFIDPTGWKGYPFEAIRPLLRRRPSEVLINFMYDHINRFAASEDEKTVASLGEILGGPGWMEKLDPTMPRGAAVAKLFREVLARESDYGAVLSTCIEKSTHDRPHFFLVYGTRHPEGVKTFRDVEYAALSKHEKLRQDAKNRKKVDRDGIEDLFGGAEVPREATVDELVKQSLPEATAYALALIKESKGLRFEKLSVLIMQGYMLRETDCKNICVKLAKDGLVRDTWTEDGKKKPHPHHWVEAF